MSDNEIHDAMRYIRNYYRVPAKVGGRIKYSGYPGESFFGTITGAASQYLLIRLDGQRLSMPYHPTWKLEYIP